MLPAFHRERILEAGEVMLDETERALAGLHAGERLDVYDWTRRLALRIAMRALFGFDPDGADRAELAHEFEMGLGYYGRDYFLQALRGPRTPWARMQLARRRIDEVIYAEIALRRAAASTEERTDLLRLLLAVRDETGEGLSDREVRDQVMTLLFAGHDTTTSTVTFLLYELARHPHELARVQQELDAVIGDAPATPAQLVSELPGLDAALDETLRLYPAAWVGPRAAVETYEFAGVQVPGGSLVNYSSWASHRLAHVFEDPDAFVPDRFTPEAKARLPKGAYVPFGAGSRMCIGMRFGQLEIKAIATRLLQRYELEQVPGRTMTVQTTPTLGPRGGLPMVLRKRS